MHRGKPIEALNCKTWEVTKYTSIAAAQRDGFCSRCIRKCLDGYRQTHKGHLWKYSVDPLKDKELDLTRSPSEVATTLGIPVDIVKNRMRYARSITGVTKKELLRQEIEPLVMQYGVSIDECAKKFCMSPKTICKILGWDND